MTEPVRLPRDPDTGGIRLFDLLRPGTEPDWASVQAALAEFADRDRAQLARDAWTDEGGHEVVVSTVDLVITLPGDAAFETMVFTDGREGQRWRYTSAAEALRGHAATLWQLRGRDRQGHPGD